GSLRDAIDQANADSAPDTIVFQSDLSGTITLTSGLLNVTYPLTIDGPGSAVLTVSGNHLQGILNTTAPLTVDNLALANGSSPYHGAVVAVHTSLTLDHVMISGSSQEYGGGVQGF